MDVVFNKYHGSGNNYLVYDCTKNSRVLSPRNIQTICSTNFGLGTDGILVGPIMEKDGIYVKVFNPDGSEAENGGNSICVFAQYLKSEGIIKEDSFILHTLKGPAKVQYSNEFGSSITVSMEQLASDQEEFGSLNHTDVTLTSEISSAGRMIVTEKFIRENQIGA